MGCSTYEPFIRLTNSNSGGGQIRGIAEGGLRFTDTTELNERVRIDASGNVGIGTNNPTSPLVVYSGYSHVKIQQKGMVPYLTIGSGSNYLVFDGVGTFLGLFDFRNDGS